MPSVTVSAARALAGRLPRLSRNEAAPLGLLLLALASVFAFGGDRSQFYRPGHHDSFSAETLTLAANLSAEHGFAGFRRQKLDEDGEREYVVYNRFPIGSYALVKLAALPFGDDFPRAVYAARLLMLAFFAAAAVLAYLALARLLGERWIALAATLWACSSYYVLYYADMVSAEASTNLFGVMLAFHGMVVHAREGRFRQLLAKTAVALALGWHAAALIAPFALLGLASEAWRARRGGARPALASLARSRYLACGAFCALVCALLLGFNLANEYRALGGEVAPLDLPSLATLARRTGIDPVFFGQLGWGAFLEAQAGGVGGALTPFALVDALGLDLAQPLHGTWRPHGGFALAGAAATAVGLAGLRWLPCRVPVAALLLAGWCWTLAFRGSTALHEFEAMFHLGVPLALGALVLLGLRRLIGRRAMWALPALALAMLALFAVSAQRMGGVGHDAEAAARQRDLAADARAVRELARGRPVLDEGIADQLWRGHFIRNYWLSGAYIQIEPIATPGEWLRVAGRGFLVVVPADFGGSLTPDNRRAFLYPLADLPRIRASIAAGGPALRSTFDARAEGGALLLTRSPCEAGDLDPPFFLDAAPPDAGGVAAVEFAFAERGVRFDGSCLARVPLPEGAAGVRAGQRDGRVGVLWEASLPIGGAAFPPAATSWEERFASIAETPPAARSVFDVRAEGGALTYARAACAEADTEARFFLHVVPEDAADLPEERRASGFDNLDFAFGERGVRYGGRCLARAALPDYPVALVRTGQFEGGVQLWETEFALPAGE